MNLKKLSYMFFVLAFGVIVSCGSAEMVIGDDYQGGKVAYILEVGDPGYALDVVHGLIATSSDQSSTSVTQSVSAVEWGCAGTPISGADGTAIGTGNQNTIDIMNGCPTAGIAARICGDLVLNGYSDWYLPSKDELNKLYLNQGAIGGFTLNEYWSSSEVLNFGVWTQDFSDSLQSDRDKDQTFYVRCVRVF